MITTLDIVAIVTLGVFKTGHSGETPSAVNEFAQQLIDTNDDFFTAFGETITYYPSGKIGDVVVGANDILSLATLGIFKQAAVGRQITAIVERQPPTDLDGAPHGHSPQLTISVANNAVSGISSSEVDTGGDKAELEIRLGETAQKRRITEILSQDAAMLELEIR